jgi:hypothetical protein
MCIACSFEQRRLSPSCSVALDAHTALVDLVVQKGTHEPLMRAVAEGLCFPPNRGGVLGRVSRALLGESAGEDLFGGPRVHGVGRDLDLQHPVGEVLAHARLR